MTVNTVMEDDYSFHESEVRGKGELGVNNATKNPNYMDPKVLEKENKAYNDQIYNA